MLKWKNMDNKRTNKIHRILFWAAVVIIILLSIASVTPLYWMTITSIKEVYNAMKIPPEIIPSNPTLSNYAKLFYEGRTPLRWLFNSVFTSGVATILVIFTSATAGYAFSKKEFPGRDIFFWIMIGTMAVPRVVFIIPLFIFITDFGWLDTYQGIIAPYITWPFGVFLMRQFMQTVPDELIDAARIDGASEIRIFLKIVLPIVKPAIGAVAIFSFNLVWNRYLWQLIVLDKDSMLTLPLAVSKLVSSYGRFDLGLAMAGATFAFIPMLLMFLFFQKYFIKGITIGSLKG